MRELGERENEAIGEKKRKRENWEREKMRQLGKRENERIRRKMRQ